MAYDREQQFEEKEGAPKDLERGENKNQFVFSRLSKGKALSVQKQKGLVWKYVSMLFTIRIHRQLCTLRFRAAGFFHQRSIFSTKPLSARTFCFYYYISVLTSSVNIRFSIISRDSTSLNHIQSTRSMGHRGMCWVQSENGAGAC